VIKPIEYSYTLRQSCKLAGYRQAVILIVIATFISSIGSYLGSFSQVSSLSTSPSSGQSWRAGEELLFLFSSRVSKINK